MCVLAAALLPAMVVAQKKKSNKTQYPGLITVNKRSVSADEFVYLYTKSNQNKPDEFTEAKINEYLDLFIKFKLKVEEARQRGLDTTQKFLSEFKGYREELRKPYLPDERLADSLVNLTYNRLQQEVKASHILINVKPDASPEDTLKAYNRILEIRKRAVSGEDFGKLASEFSEDPSAKTNQGSLGFFTAMQMVYSFETAAYQTEVGQISEPVRSRFGYHIIKVEDKKPARGEVEVSHIMIRLGAERDAVAAKNLAFEIYDQVKGGVAWEELCKQYSEDLNSKNNGGRLRPFGVGAMASVPEFDKVAFALENPGDISDPFETAYGWHIVKLERKIPLPSLQELSSSLKNRVTRDERMSISKQAAIKKLKVDFKFNENESTVKKALSLADTSLTKARWKIPTTNFNKETLFTVAGKSYSVADFYQFVAKSQRNTSLKPEAAMQQFYQSFADEQLYKAFEEKIQLGNPEYTYLLNEYYEGILLFEIMEKEVWNKAADDSVGQRAYYETHRNQYQAGERVKAVLYSSANKENVKNLKAAIAAGQDELIKEMIDKKQLRREEGNFEKEDRPLLSKIPWQKGVFTAENNGMYYLAQILDILPPGNKSFEDSRPAVISDYQGELEHKWLAALQKKYAVKVNEKGKRYVLQKLVK
jgi:peptidyl-prolyl cis-trans isomerase SurA